MTDIISPEAAAAREADRKKKGEAGAGQFGEHAHSAPDTTVVAPPAPERTHADDLRNLSDMVGQQSYQLDMRYKESRLASFVADAREYVPAAVGASFTWEYDFEAGNRLVFDDYYDKAGDPILDADYYPEIMDFHFDDHKQARGLGFEGLASDDGATITFEEVHVPDADKARAELNAREAFEHERDGDTLTHLVTGFTGDKAGFTDAQLAERLGRLTDHDKEQIAGILASALFSARNYLKHS